MAGGSLLTLLDDIASILDDVSVMSKVAVKKTAGVLGDDLALNAQQVTGVTPDRELPVVWAVAKGSLVNKAILVPSALAISAVAPKLVIPLLMFGGLFLCYEGFEKIVHKFLHHDDEEASPTERLEEASENPDIDIVESEKSKILGAVRTDFILSAEIIVITLGTVATEPFLEQVLVLIAISLIMTVGVYGLVAGIVKLDDLGMRLYGNPDAPAKHRFRRSVGAAILKFAPYLMKGLSIAGTVAMFMVGGSILTHNVSVLHHFGEHVAEVGASVPGAGGILRVVAGSLFDTLAGLIAGGIALAIMLLLKKLFRR